jgi:hypothetical protein
VSQDSEGRNDMTDAEKVLLEAVLVDIAANGCDWQPALVALAHKIWEERVSPELVQATRALETDWENALERKRRQLRELEEKYPKDSIEVARAKVRAEFKR